jgi:hypothetical protein
VDCESHACPVSIITPESEQAIQKFFSAQRVQKGAGGVLYGPDSSAWPARWFDTVSILQGEIERADNAFEAAKATYISTHQQ